MRHFQIAVGFITHPKVKRACRVGAEALQLWVAMRSYCEQNLTDGFVPDDMLDELEGAPKNPRRWLEVLVQCGEPKDTRRGPGLVEPVEGGWQLHDFFDWGMSRAEVLRRQEQAKARKERHKERWQGTLSERVPEPVPERDRNASRNASQDAFGTERTRAAARARDCTALHGTALHSTEEETRAPAREPPPPSDVHDSERETLCPTDLELPERAAKELAERYGQSFQTIRAAEQEFVGYWTIGGGAGRKRRHWLSRLREDIRKKHESGKLERLAGGNGAAKPAAEAAPNRPATLDERPEFHGNFVPPPPDFEKGLEKLFKPPATRAPLRAVATPDKPRARKDSDE